MFNLLPAVNGPDVSLTPSAVDFGDVMVGQSAEQVITVSNVGTAELTLYNISLADWINYTQTNDCPAILLPATACQILVTFTPTLSATLTDTLTVQSDDADQPTISASLTGNGVTLLPDLTVTSMSIPRTLTGGRWVTLGMTVSNQGTANVAGGYWVSLYLAGSLIAAEYVTDAPVAGGDLTVSWYLQLPDLKRGTYTLEAVADMGDAIMELNESNNTLSKSVKIK